MARIVGVLEAPRINIDARKQFAILGKLDEGALRALASGDVIEGEAVEEVSAIAETQVELVSPIGETAVATNVAARAVA